MAALGSAQMVSTGGGSSVLGIFVSVLLNLVPGMYERCVCSKPCAILVVAVGTHCCVHESTASARHARYGTSIRHYGPYITAPSHHTWQTFRVRAKLFIPPALPSQPSFNAAAAANLPPPRADSRSRSSEDIGRSSAPFGGLFYVVFGLLPRRVPLDFSVFSSSSATFRASMVHGGPQVNCGASPAAASPTAASPAAASPAATSPGAASPAAGNVPFVHS